MLTKSIVMSVLLIMPVALAAGPAAAKSWQDEHGKGKNEYDYKEEYKRTKHGYKYKWQDGNCKYEYKTDKHGYKEKRKCKGGAHYTGGPPPWAPAHGYRHKHQTGAEIVFDSHLGVYIVAGRTNIYFHDGWFLRIRSGNWEVSASLDGQWKARSSDRVPPGLRSKHHAKKPKARGRGAANSKW